jgi:peptidoglycan/LPS O-acetylase OafA/YrhL
MTQLHAERPALLQPAAEAAPAAAAPRLRLESIDALRALAAIAVVLVHSFEIYGLGLPDVGNSSGGLTASAEHQLIRSLYEWIFRLGGLAVPVFIVLSGFSLMIPVARSSPSLRSAAQLRTFFLRRIKRIVPPYYIALLCSAALIATIPGLGQPAGVYWDRAISDLDLANVVAHLLLMHNIHPSWIDSFNPPSWSLAVEWQIYFLFPLLVVLWRRLGLIALLGAALIYGIAPLYLPITVLPFTHSHFVLLFALGMAGAIICFATSGVALALRNRPPWALLALGGFAVFAAMHAARQGLGLPLPDGWLPELIVGGAVAALVIHGTRSQLEGRETRAERLLSHRALTGIGSFSYSLYLVHLPILAALALLARSLELSTTAAYALVFAAGLPLSLLASYGFHLLFERPFLNAPPVQAARTGRA